MCDINNPIFQNEISAREFLEAIRWPDGPFCPHCGEAEKVTRLEGKASRPGVVQCNSCRKQFSVTVGTLFERSKIPLHKWLYATHLLSASKKGISTHQLHRMLGITYKSAWFMTHRIREAMREPVSPDTVGGGGSTVEVDETFWGSKYAKKPGSGGYAHKEAILTLVERQGRAQSYHIPSVSGANIKPILRQQIEEDTHIMTDQAKWYRWTKYEFLSHHYVHHGIGEYVRGDVHSNTVEGYFSILKRGLTGTYQHVSGKHLKRYLGEFDFRYNFRTKLGYSDSQRAIEVLKGITGKRLTYRGTRARQ